MYEAGTFFAHEADGRCMAARPKLPRPVEETLDEIMDEHDYNTYGEAIRHALREAGYDV